MELQNKYTTIAITEKTWTRLNKLKDKRGLGFDDVVISLLDFHDRYHGVVDRAK